MASIGFTLICDKNTIYLFNKFIFEYGNMSVTDSLYLSQPVCYRHILSVTDSFCLSQTVFVCRRQSVSVKDTLLDHSLPNFSLF